MAMQIVESQAGEWDPKKYEDRYRASVLKLIRAKAKGKDIVVEKEAEPERVSDLMEALRQSVEAARQRAPSGGRRRSGAASKTATAKTSKKSTSKATKRSTAKRTRRTKAA
jgi:DNA end-binding protein Ku